MMKATQPVAFFDSGLGGISVLRELRRLMPREQFLYFGDSALAPYGTRSTEEVRNLTLQRIEELTDDQTKAVVIACNTATSAAIESEPDRNWDRTGAEAGGGALPRREDPGHGNKRDTAGRKVCPADAAVF